MNDSIHHRQAERMNPTALDIEQPDMLLAYLRGTSRIGLDEPVQMRLLSGGVSNRTVLVRRPDGEAWVIKQALTRLRVAAEWTSDPRRVHREAAGLRCLARIAPDAVAPFVFEDFTHHLFAMQAVPEPHANWKQRLLAGRVDLQHVEGFATLLARIHRFGCDEADALGAEFADCSFFESLRIEPYYEYSARRAPAAETFIRELVDACRRRRYTLVHGDYSPKNVLVCDRRIVLLDHEVIHFGDGAFDVGFAMAHLLSKAHHLPEHREAFAQAAHRFWQIYQDHAAGTLARQDVESFAVRHTLGCLLARAVGRSPLEYLAPGQREDQARTVTELMGDAPDSMPRLIDSFTQRL